ncbi:MAG: lipoate--protein ligase family protein [Planctomycetes bacterium]|nr:lipoate--protein ligase family protein [Planctomycetota bacterium]
MNRLTWRLLVDAPADAPRNMGVDEALLRQMDQADPQPQPTLRFYQWRPPAVSIGYAQRAASFHPEKLRQQGYGFVRRLTGGGAIFHHRELTYSFVASVLAGDVPQDTDRVYSLLNLGLVEGLRALGLESRPRGCQTACPKGEETPFCTARASPYDLVASGHKLLGSAQRWTRRSVLQHGFLPLEPNPMTPEVLSLQDALGRPVSFSEAAEALRTGFVRALGVALRPGELLAEEAGRASDHAIQYASDAWNFRR